MTEEIRLLSDAEVTVLLQKASQEYEKYAQLIDVPTPDAVMPTYSPANPVGLVVDAFVD